MYNRFARRRPRAETRHSVLSAQFAGFLVCLDCFLSWSAKFSIILPFKDSKRANRDFGVDSVCNISCKLLFQIIASITVTPVQDLSICSSHQKCFFSISEASESVHLQPCVKTTLFCLRRVQGVPVWLWNTTCWNRCRGSLSTSCCSQVQTPRDTVRPLGSGAALTPSGGNLQSTS